MAAADTWSELGIEPTADAAAIRRAYAARLKAVRPDADPHGFARLRGAYERALRAAETPPDAAPTGVSPPPRPDIPAAPPKPLPPEIGAITDAVRRGDVLAAAMQLVAARTGGLMSLEQDLRLADQLGWAMAQDRSLPADAVLASIGQLGWVRDDDAAPWAAPLWARLDAETWLAALRRDAASRWVWLAASKAVSARILLGRGKLRTLPSMGADPTLRRRYGEFLFHAPVVGGQFDPVRIDAVADLLVARPAKLLGFVGTFFGVVMIGGIVGAAIGDVAPQFKDAATGLTTIGLFLLLYVRRLLRRRRG